MLKMGERARDRITGFEGIVMGRTEYINGCVKILLQPEGVKADGTGIKAGEWFDEQLVDPDATATAGGPMPPPPRA